MNIKKAVAMGVVAGLLFSLLPVAVLAVQPDSPGPRQQWYLDDEKDVVPGWADYIMYRANEEQPKGDVAVGIKDGDVPGSIVWRADEVPLADVTFSGGIWDAHMKLVEGPGYDLDLFDLQLVVFAADGSLSVVAGRESYYKIAGNRTKFTIDAPVFTVPGGNYLGFMAINNSTVPIGVKTGETEAWIKSPNTSAIYPLPEVSTIALFMTGLVCLGGYMILRRRSLANDS